MADDSLFRKAALDKLASPERLDVLMQVTRPRDRIATWTILGLLLAVLGWAIFSRQPDRLAGRGAIQEGTGAQSIQATSDGTLSDFPLSYNQVVVAEQVVGQIRSVSREVDVQKLEADVAAAEMSANNIIAQADAAIGEHNLELGRRQFELDENARQRAQVEIAVNRGDQPKNDLLKFNERKSAIESQISQIKSQIAQRNAEKQTARSSVAQARSKLTAAHDTQQASTNVTSPIDGRVVQILRRPGETVRRGEVLAQIVPMSADEPLNVVAFVSAQLGQRIRKGQPVQVVVNGIKTEDAGFLRGEIAWVSSSYATPVRVMDVMKEGLDDPVYEVHIAPIPDTTISGYAWSTGIGPPQRLEGGSFVNINVEVGTYAPISRLPAYLRSLLGAS